MRRFGDAELHGSVPQLIATRRMDLDYVRELRDLAHRYPDPFFARLEAFAEGVERWGRCPSLDLQERLAIYGGAGAFLSFDREQAGKRRGSNPKPVEWFEDRQEQLKVDQFALGLPAKLAADVARTAIPFAELRRKPTRRACLEALGGEERVRQALEAFHREFEATREWLSLEFARMEWLERDAAHNGGKVDRDRRDDLGELLAGVRNLSVEARCLGAPKDVLAFLDVWHYRVLVVVHEAERKPPRYAAEYGKALRRLKAKIRKARSLSAVREDDRVNPKTPRHRYLRHAVEKALLGRLSREDVAILETAWLLPVKGKAESNEDVVPESEAACMTPRPELPTRPVPHPELPWKTSATEARAYYGRRFKELGREKR